MAESELKPLSKKHQRVLDEYLLLFNQTAAYMKVYPKTTYESARTAAARLFAGDNFLGHVTARLNEAHMGADEALKLLADMARGDVGEFLNDYGGVDVSQARVDGKLKLIKKWKTKTVTINGKQEDKEIHTEEIELYDAQSAIEKILKVHGKLVNRVEGPGEGGAFPIESKIDDERFNRAISTLADAIREGVSGKGNKSDSKVDTSK